MSDIFISYARKDRARAQVVARTLEHHGYSVWWDRNIPPGKTFDEVIQEALNAARCIIVLWSATSVRSDWVKEEASEGQRRGVLVPVLIDEVPIPLGFGRLQTAGLVGWQGEPGHPELQQLLQSIGELVRQMSAAQQPALAGAGRSAALPNTAESTVEDEAVRLLLEPTPAPNVAAPTVQDEAARLLLEPAPAVPIAVPAAAPPRRRRPLLAALWLLLTAAGSGGGVYAYLAYSTPVASPLAATPSPAAGAVAAPTPAVDAGRPVAAPAAAAHTPPLAAAELDPAGAERIAEVGEPRPTAPEGDVEQVGEPAVAAAATPQGIAGAGPASGEESPAAAEAARAELEGQVFRRFVALQVAELDSSRDDAELLAGYSELQAGFEEYLAPEDAAKVGESVAALAASVERLEELRAMDADDGLPMVEKLDAWRSFRPRRGDGPAARRAAERIAELDAALESSASIRSADKFVTCRSIERDPLRPLGVGSRFRPGRVTVFAWVHAPRQETLKLEWLGPRGSVVKSQPVEVLRNIAEGYRFFYNKTYQEAGTSEVRLYNGVGVLIGRSVFEVGS